MMRSFNGYPMNDFERCLSLILKRVQPLSEQACTSKELVEALSLLVADVVVPQSMFSALVYDHAHPYSRKVLLNDKNLEVMLARWTPNVPCHPHDHGDSHSAILVLHGCAEHTRFQLQTGVLKTVHTEYKNKGEVIVCGPNQIHAMKAHPELITLHLYTESIDNMLIFDEDVPSTVMVDGGCGAWLPVDKPEGIIARRDGHVSRESFQEEKS